MILKKTKELSLSTVIALFAFSAALSCLKAWHDVKTDRFNKVYPHLTQAIKSAQNSR